MHLRSAPSSDEAEMDGLHLVLAATLALALACISYSTWTTVADLQEIVRQAEKAHLGAAEVDKHNWQGLASRAIQHIEHRSHDTQHHTEAFAIQAVGARHTSAAVLKWAPLLSTACSKSSVQHAIVMRCASLDCKTMPLCIVRLRC